MKSHAVAEAMVCSKSLARRRLRFSQAKVRSPPQRRGKSSKPLATSDRLPDLIIAPGTGRAFTGISKARSMFVPGRWGDRQFAADRLDTQFPVMGVDERHHHLPWRSSSA